MYDSLSDLAQDVLDAAALPDADRWVAMTAFEAGEDRWAICDAVLGTTRPLPIDLVDAVQEDLDDGLFDDLPELHNTLMGALAEMRSAAESG
ncbi:MAG: hypothetical protein QM662_05010 [Gordonia sp. (in: high G+C Gram-positive bacteria)]